MQPIGPSTFHVLAGASIRQHEQAIEQALERLSTGKRINRASDDPSGAMALDHLTVEQRRMEDRIERIELDNVRLAAREGAMGVLGDLVLELEGLVVQAANRDALDEGELEALQIEADSVVQAIDHVAATTTFKGERIIERSTSDNLGNRTLEGDAGEPATTADPPEGDAEPMRVSLADIAGGRALNLIDGDLEAAQLVVRDAREGLARARSTIGAGMRRHENELSALRMKLEANANVRSSIGDTDFAEEISNLVRSQVLQQSATAATIIGRNERGRALQLLTPGR